MPLAERALAAATLVAVLSVSTRADERPALHLYQEVLASDLIVVATVLDEKLAVVHVDEVLKGSAASSIRLVRFVDPYLRSSDQRRLVPGTQELMFLNKVGDAYAPVDTQSGRWPIHDGLVQATWLVDELGLPDYRTTITTLVRSQARVDRGGADATDAFVEGLKSTDPHVRLWAAQRVARDLSGPSDRLVEALLTAWSTHDAEMMGSVANAVVKWHLPQVAPFFARAATTAGDGYERATAALALGGTRDPAYVGILRQMASVDRDWTARAFAYEGIMDMLGATSLPDLRQGAKDPDERVRAAVVGDAYNMLELRRPQARWPVSDDLIADVRRFVAEMKADPAPLVAGVAKSTLAMIDNRHPQQREYQQGFAYRRCCQHPWLGGQHRRERLCHHFRILNRWCIDLPKEPPATKPDDASRITCITVPDVRAVTDAGNRFR